MPLAALRKGAADHVAKLSRVPELLIELTKTAAASRVRDVDPVLRFEVADAGKVIELEKFAKPSSFICRDCGGGLWKLDTGGTPRYRCEVGHHDSIEALGENQKLQLERALWAAIRSLEDRAKLSRELENAWRDRGVGNVAEHFAEEANIAATHGARLRELLDIGSR